VPGPTPEHFFEAPTAQGSATVHFLPPGITDPWLLLMLLTAGWCILYSLLVCAIGCLNSGVRATNSTSHRVDLTPLTPFLANNLTSFANTLLSITAVSVFAVQLKADGVSLASSRLVAGPLIENTSIFYIAFAAYCVYDMLWVVFLQPSIDKEASGPFVCMLHTLRELGITKGKLYTANGVIMTITFGVFRVLLPLLAIIHVFVHWNSSAINARINWRIILCITLINGGYCLQLYWFGKIIRGLMKHVIDSGDTDDGPDLEDSQPFMDGKGGSSSMDRRRSLESSRDPMLSVRSTGDSAAGAG
ncbi:hypothetical protein FOZ63_027964, partial [Perkinsus olseni]